MPTRSLWRAFADAADGLRRTFREQPNFRIQVGLGILAAAAAAGLHFDVLRWALLGVIVGSVLAAELFNTCLEHAIDLVEPRAHPLARAAKHAGAAGVLALSLAAAAAGVLLYGQAILHAIRAPR
jgi:diacylglycerol kinase